jgi:hypothetical protein
LNTFRIAAYPKVFGIDGTNWVRKAKGIWNLAVSHVASRKINLDGALFFVPSTNLSFE